MAGYYDPKTFCAQRSVGYLIKRCAALMVELAETRFAERGLSFTQWLVLMKLRDKSPLSLGELANDLGHDQGALTRVVHVLESSGKVERRRSDVDRRAVEIRLTEDGLESIEEQIPMVVEGLNELFTDFTRDETDQLINQLEHLLNRLIEFKQRRGETAP